MAIAPSGSGNWQDLTARERLQFPKYKLKEAIFVNKMELVAKVAEKSELTKKDAEKAVNALFESVKEALVKKDKVQMIGFGTFEVKARAARKGRNPQTGAEIKIPASKNPVFKAGKGLKDAVNKKEAAGKKKK